MKDRNELKRISAHLYYEFEMFTALTLNMHQGVTTGLVNNALVQSFALHVRNLIDFLYNDRHQPDDVFAGDFFNENEDWRNIRIAITPGLQKAKRRANKEVAHLTYSRLAVTQEEKLWAFVELAGEMVRAFDPFVANVERSLLEQQWENFYKFRDNWSASV